MSSDNSQDDAPLTMLAETERFAVLLGEDLDGEQIYNIELGNVTIHLFVDEWKELIQLIDDARS
jgi:hypothetical protein